MAGSASVSGEPLLRRGLRVLGQVKEVDGEDFGLRDVERDGRIGRGKADRREGERARGGEDDHSISHLMIPVSVRDGSATHTTGATPTACRGDVAETLVGIVGIAELSHAPHARTHRAIADFDQDRATSPSDLERGRGPQRARP